MNIISNYWDEHIERMVNDLYKEGVPESAVLYKVADAFNKILPTQSASTVVPTKVTSGVAPNTGYKHKNPHEAKCLSDRFYGAIVYVTGNMRSLAKILPGPNNKSCDILKLIDTGAEMTVEDYLVKFVPDTTGSGSSHRNPCKIKFRANPAVSLGMVKRNWDDFKSIKDIANYRRLRKV